MTSLIVTFSIFVCLFYRKHYFIVLKIHSQPFDNIFWCWNNRYLVFTFLSSFTSFCLYYFCLDSICLEFADFFIFIQYSLLNDLVFFYTFFCMADKDWIKNNKYDYSKIRILSSLESAYSWSLVVNSGEHIG